MTNSYTLVPHRKTGQSAFIYINNTPRTEKRAVFPPFSEKKQSALPFAERYGKSTKALRNFCINMQKMQKIYKKLHIFSSFVFFCFFPYSEKGDFRFPAANRNEGIIASFPSFRLLSDKIIFYRDIKEKRKNAPSCGGNATQKPPFPDAKTRRESGKVLSYYKYILCRPPKKKTAPFKKGAPRGKR